MRELIAPRQARENDKSLTAIIAPNRATPTPYLNFNQLTHTIASMSEQITDITTVRPEKPSLRLAATSSSRSSSPSVLIRHILHLAHYRRKVDQREIPVLLRGRAFARRGRGDRGGMPRGPLDGRSCRSAWQGLHSNQAESSTHAKDRAACAHLGAFVDPRHVSPKFGVRFAFANGLAHKPKDVSSR